MDDAVPKRVPKGQRVLSLQEKRPQGPCSASGEEDGLSAAGIDPLQSDEGIPLRPIVA